MFATANESVGHEFLDIDSELTACIRLLPSTAELES